MFGVGEEVNVYLLAIAERLKLLAPGIIIFETIVGLVMLDHRENVTIPGVVGLMVGSLVLLAVIILIQVAMEND